MSLSKNRIDQILKEEHPEVVSQLWASMAAENERLRNRINEIEKENAEREQQILNFEENIKMLRKTIFDKSSEKRHEASDRPRDKGQMDALLFSQSAFPSVETREEAKSGGADLEPYHFCRCADDLVKAHHLPHLKA